MTTTVPTMKWCKGCGAEKPTTEFYAHNTTADRLFPVCKTCWCARTRKHRAEHDEVRSRDRARAQRPDRRAFNRRWVKDHADPERQRIYAAVSRAVARGDIVRQPCEVCGSTDVQAHHDDYSKPFDVRWLCPRHHKLHHVGVAS